MKKDEIEPLYIGNRTSHQLVSNVPDKGLEPEKEDNHSLAASVIGIKLQLQRKKEKNLQFSSNDRSQSGRSNIKQIEKFAQDIFDNPVINREIKQYGQIEQNGQNGQNAQNSQNGQNAQNESKFEYFFWY